MLAEIETQIERWGLFPQLYRGEGRLASTSARDAEW